MFSHKQDIAEIKKTLIKKKIPNDLIKHIISFIPICDPNAGPSTTCYNCYIEITSEASSS